MMDFSTLALAALLELDFSGFDADTLAAYQAEIESRFTAAKEVEGAPTAAQVAEATALRDQFRAVKAFAADQAPVSEEDAEAFAGLSLDDDEDEETDEATDEAEVDEVDEAEEAEDESDDEGEDTVEVETVEEPEVQAEEPPAKKVAAAATRKGKVAASVALAGKRPTVTPKSTKQLVTITAAADTQYAAGTQIGLEDLGNAAVYRLEGLPEPSGDGETEDLRKFPVGNIAVPYPAELQIDKSMSEESIQAVLETAADESRLEGESLVASNGWCAPSETLYDLCGGEVVDGILSIPEVQVNRGGFKHTTGIDFSTIYSGVGFLQTEAQAISGTTKTCYEVPCPTFVDERLDAIGLCIKVPILLEVGYPEAVKRVMSASMIAHQYKVNASVITRLLAIAGAATALTPVLGTVYGALFNMLDIQADIIRQKYRLGSTASIEVVLPVWAKDVLRNEIGLRTGRDSAEGVSDQELMSNFAVRHLNVQFVYGWQEWTGTELTWPAAVNALIYPAGTVVKGVSNVINLSAVYDAASLATNIYTGLFFEQGLLVAKMCYEVRQVTIPVTGNFTGKTGAASL